jgi:hypothetical protein
VASDERVSGDREKTRLCPTCRCAISVLATKCRFCGESVGRPKDETRSLSIEDLGGETVVHYAPSSNVMEALEAFRMEEGPAAAPPEPKKKTLFGKKAASTESNSGIKSDHGLPELDERSKALASLMVPSRTVASPKTHDTSWMKKVAFLGGFIAVVVILYFGSIQVSAVIRGWGADDSAKMKYTNPAIAMIKSGAPAMDIHREAYKAVQKDDSPENQQILADARKQVTEEIQALLSSPTVTLHGLRAASNLAAQALADDKGTEIQELKAQVDAENSAFAMSLVSTDTKASPPTAILRLSDRSQKTVTQGETFGDRFVVKVITDKYVRLVDTKYKKPSGEGERAVMVDREGIPK